MNCCRSIVQKVYSALVLIVFKSLIQVSDTELGICFSFAKNCMYGKHSSGYLLQSFQVMKFLFLKTKLTFIKDTHAHNSGIWVLNN